MDSMYAPKSGLAVTVPRLLQDMEALVVLTELDLLPELPVLRVIWPTYTVLMFYGFGDTSGKQFGSTMAKAHDWKSKLCDKRSDSCGLVSRIGIWTVEQELESSNFKEFGNLLDSIEAGGASGRLKKCKFFMFTDSSTARSYFRYGSSSSSKSHQLVVRLRKLEMKYGISVHL